MNFYDVLFGRKLEGGGGITIEQMADGSVPSGVLDISGLTLNQYAFSRRNNITRVQNDGVSEMAIRQNAFDNCKGITSVNVQNLASQFNDNGANSFNGCSNLEVAVVGYTSDALSISNFVGCSKLKVCDIVTTKRVRNLMFSGCTILDTIIIRDAVVVGMEGTSVFNNSPFKNGGSGGTIYIPETLYNHLGDGSANDYKSATNWSTVDGWGVITWAKIEGSIYENAYADGTPIS